MKRLSAEFKVGIFVLIIIGILSFMTFKVGFFDFLQGKGYVLYATFNDIGGLDQKSKIKIAGVDAGVVDRVDLVNGRARLTLRMDTGIILYSDATATIKSRGLLGDKYLAVTTGTKEPPLKTGDTITNAYEMVNIDDAVKKMSSIAESITRLTDNLNDVFGTEESKNALKAALQNLKSITSKLDVAVTENERRLRKTLDTITKLAESLQGVVDENSEPFKNTLANFEDFTKTLKEDGPELVKNIKAASGSLKNISAQIDSGEGTIGKLVKDEKLYTTLNRAAEGLDNVLGTVDRFRTFLTFQGDYLLKPEEGKGYFYLTLQPRPDKYYILGIVGDPLGSVRTTYTERTIDGVTSFEEEIKTRTKLEFTAQFAKRFYDTVFRVGLTENTFGAGIDQFLFKDRLKLVTDVWNISGDNEEGSDEPHIRVGAELFMTKNIFLTGGYDNFLNSRWSGFFVGAGVRFEDEDIKYLLGSASKIPSN